MMDEEKKEKEVISHSILPQVLNMILEKIKLIPKDHTLELEIIGMMMTISTEQAKMIQMLRQELQKCAQKNKLQAAGLRNRGIINIHGK